VYTDHCIGIPNPPAIIREIPLISILSRIDVFRIRKITPSRDSSRRNLSALRSLGNEQASRDSFGCACGTYSLPSEEARSATSNDHVAESQSLSRDEESRTKIASIAPLTKYVREHRISLSRLAKG